MLIARAAAAAAAMRLSLSRAASSSTPSWSRQAMSWKTPKQQRLSSPPPLLLSVLTRRRLASIASASAPPSASETSSQLEPPDVRKLAKMAQLEVTDEEVADWEPKIRKIVSWFDQLQAVDLEAEEEKERQAEQQGTAEAAETTFSLRSDEVSQFGGDPAEALREAPEKEGEFLKVPRIM